MRISGKAKQLSWDSHREWPSLPIYNLISAWACGNEEADFQRPTQGWAQFSTTSKFTVFEMQPTDKDGMSLSHKPGLLSEQVSWLMITPVVFDRWFLEDHHSACCSAPLLGLRSTLTHLTKVGIKRVHKLYSEVTQPQQNEHGWAVLGASLSVTSTIRAAGGAKKERMIQLLITCATERNNLATPNLASSRFWFSSDQQKSNQNREDENQKGRQRRSLELNELHQLAEGLLKY